MNFIRTSRKHGELEVPTGGLDKEDKSTDQKFERLSPDNANEEHLHFWAKQVNPSSPHVGRTRKMDEIDQ